MNNKGMLPIVACYTGLFVSAVILAAVTRPQHIIKRYVEKCVSDGVATEEICRADCMTLAQADRIEYIRDK